MIEVNRTAISLFGIHIHWYALLIVTGILLGVLLAMRREKQLGLPAETTIDIALIGVPTAIVGARIYYVAFSWEQFANRPFWKVFAVWEGGIAIYGAILGGLLAGWMYSRRKHLSFLHLADLAAPSLALGQAIGRWGNFVNQEAHGALVQNPTLQFFPIAVSIRGAWYYATFFYESIWCFLIVSALLNAEKKHLNGNRGDLFFGYVFLYALERAVVEGMRTDSLYWGNVRVSQALSLLAAAAIAVHWSLRCKRAPLPLRIASVICAFAAIATTVLGHLGLTFAFAAATLTCTLGMIILHKKTPMKNRGENL